MVVHNISIYLLVYICSCCCFLFLTSAQDELSTLKRDLERGMQVIRVGPKELFTLSTSSWTTIYRDLPQHLRHRTWFRTKYSLKHEAMLFRIWCHVVHVTTGNNQESVNWKLTPLYSMQKCEFYTNLSEARHFTPYSCHFLCCITMTMGIIVNWLSFLSANYQILTGIKHIMTS